MRFKMLSAICFNLDQSKILSSDNELRVNNCKSEILNIILDNDGVYQNISMQLTFCACPCCTRSTVVLFLTFQCIVNFIDPSSTNGVTEVTVALNENRLQISNPRKGAANVKIKVFLDVFFLHCFM